MSCLHKQEASSKLPLSVLTNGRRLGLTKLLHTK